MLNSPKKRAHALVTLAEPLLTKGKSVLTQLNPFSKRSRVVKAEDKKDYGALTRENANNKTFTLPMDVWALILEKVSLKDYAVLARVSKTFRLLMQSDTLWQKPARARNMPLDWQKENLPTFSLKARLKKYIEEETQKIVENYPQALIESFSSPREILFLPFLPLASKEAYPQIEASQLKGHKMKRGIDSLGRNFITLCAEKDGEVLVETLFQRFLQKKHWERSGDSILPATLEKAAPYLKRLHQGETCGAIKRNRNGFLIEESEERNVSLSDQLKPANK